MGDITRIDNAIPIEITDGNSQSAVLSSSNPSTTDIGLVVRPIISTNTSSITSVDSSSSNVTLLSSNSSRISALFYNNSTASLFLKLGTNASSSSFTVKIPSNGYYELPCKYIGTIDGIWDSANGAVLITEIL